MIRNKPKVRPNAKAKVRPNAKPNVKAKVEPHVLWRPTPSVSWEKSKVKLNAEQIAKFKVKPNAKAEVKPTVKSLLRAQKQAAKFRHRAREYQRGFNLAKRDIEDLRKQLNAASADRIKLKHEAEILGNELDKALSKVRGLRAEVARLKVAQEVHAGVVARVEAWEQAKREGREMHSEASQENVVFRRQRTQMRLSLIEVITYLQEDAPKVAVAIEKLKGLVG